MKIPNVLNIQKFSTHDGDGTRTTIFFKGCPLKCKWCHNPESQKFEKELILYKDRCTLCGNCVKRGKPGVNEIVDGKLVVRRDKWKAEENCVDFCPSNAREVAGKEYTIGELVKEAKKDLIFYDETGGGVTLSGGEVMSQNMDFVEELCKRIHNEGIGIFIDTSGYAPYENFKRILPYVDVFLYDLKAMDDNIHKKFTGGSNKIILDNLIKLNNDNAKIYLRMPIIESVNGNDEFIMDVISFIKTNNINIVKTAILPYHDLGKSKYENLGLVYEEGEMKVPTKAKLNHFKELFLKNGFKEIEIGG